VQGAFGSTSTVAPLCVRAFCDAAPVRQIALLPGLRAVSVVHAVAMNHSGCAGGKASASPLGPPETKHRPPGAERRRRAWRRRRQQCRQPVEDGARALPRLRAAAHYVHRRDGACTRWREYCWACDSVASPDNRGAGRGCMRRACPTTRSCLGPRGVECVEQQRGGNRVVVKSKGAVTAHAIETGAFKMFVS
jgi:hypothetical protein